jgi:uncharacterized protein
LQIARLVTTGAIERTSWRITQNPVARQEEAMELIKRLEPIVLVLVVIGAVNWGLVGVFEWNLVEEIFGTGTVTDVVYAIVGVAGLMMLPRLFEDFRVSTHRTRPTGA